MNDSDTSLRTRRRAALKVAAHLGLYTLIAVSVGLVLGLLTGFPSWLVSGIGGGIFVTIVFGLYHVYKVLRGDRQAGSSHETVLRRELSQRQAQELLAATVAEAQERNPRWRIAKQSPDSAKITVPVNPWSWGERMSLAAEGGSIRATSRCSFPPQIFDWGKNRENVDELRRSFERAARSGSSSVRQPGPET